MKMVTKSVSNPALSENTFWIKDLSTSTALLDINFKFVDASYQLKRKFYLEDADILGKTIFEIFPSFSRDWKEKMRFAMEGLKDIQVMVKIDMLNGSSKKVLWRLNAWRNKEGSTIGLVINAEDVTKVKDLERELLKLKNRLSEKGELAKIGSWEFLVEQEQILISQNAQKIFDLNNCSQFSLGLLQKLLGENNKELIQQTLFEAIQNGIPWNKSLKVCLKNGDEILMNTIGRPKFKNGKCHRIVGTVQIVNIKTESASNQTNKINALNASKKVEDYFSNSPSAMVLLDVSNRKILRVNEELLKIVNLKQQHLQFKNYSEFLKNENKSTLLLIRKQLRDFGKFEKIDIPFISESNEQKTLSVSGKLVNFEENLLCEIKDVTEDRKREKDLANNLKKSNNHIKKLVNYTHIITHNLKGHATNFSLMVDLLKETSSQKEYNQILNVLKYSTENLSETIGDLRSMVAIKENYTSKKSSLLLNDFVYKALQNLSGEIRKVDAKVINEITNSQKIVAFPFYLENILTNCISNAVKFRKLTKTPIISISATTTKEYTILSIEDNGVGMNLSERGDKLFKIGSSLGNLSDSKGMGLYLTNYQVEIMNGKIEVESTPNEGSIFKIFFPNN